jgi:transmembrane sensor
METRSRPNQQILDEAAEWFVDFRDGGVNAATQIQFNRWLCRSPDHVKAYLEIAALWSDVPNLASKEEIDIQVLIAYALEEDNVVPLGTPGGATLREEPNSLSQPEAPKPAFQGVTQLRRLRTHLTARPIRWVASLLIVCVGAAGTAYLELQRGLYTTDIGEQRSITLDDGSTVELNAKSRIRVRFTDQARDVDLIAGQALFHVATDNARAFVVRSGEAHVRAVGTEFDVYRRRSGTTVSVIEGQVAVSLNDSSAGSRAFPETPGAGTARSLPPSNAVRASTRLLVSAGEQVVVTAQSAARLRPADVAIATAWTQRQIVFQGTPLGDVVEEFNRYNRKQMVINDETLRPIRVSGVFSSTEPASLLRFLREQVQLAVTERDGTLEISRK